MNAFKPNRPTDKGLVASAHSLTTAQKSTTLITATFPCTFTGLRWELSAVNTTAGADVVFWAIVLVKDGNAAGTMGSSDAAPFYNPEQNVLAFGQTRLGLPANGEGNAQWSGSTKTMRKLMGGDKVLLIVNNATATVSFNGVVQFFCKT